MSILGVYAAKSVMAKRQTVLRIKPNKNPEELDFVFPLTIKRQLFVILIMERYAKIKKEYIKPPKTLC